MIQTPTINVPSSVVAETVLQIPEVPFYSQFKDIKYTKWQKVGCGVASLAMIIDYYRPEAISVNKILEQGIASNSYLNSAGWIHSGLIAISKKYGLDGKSYDLTSHTEKAAYKKLKEHLKDGPVMVSVHYKFDPKNPIPHLVVIDAIDGDKVYYSDPASDKGNKEMVLSKFRKSWNKKFIVIRPTTSKLSLL